MCHLVRSKINVSYLSGRCMCQPTMFQPQMFWLFFWYNFAVFNKNLCKILSSFRPLHPFLTCLQKEIKRIQLWNISRGFTALHSLGYAALFIQHRPASSKRKFHFILNYALAETGFFYTHEKSMSRFAFHAEYFYFLSRFFPYFQAVKTALSGLHLNFLNLFYLLELWIVTS